MNQIECTTFSGYITELRFALDATNHGLSVSAPVIERKKYDYVVDNGSELFRIQVKKSSDFSKYYGRDQHKVVLRWGNNKKHGYTREMVDIFAVFLEQKETWYLIPSYAVEGERNIYIDDNETDSFFYQFRNGWDLDRYVKVCGKIVKSEQCATTKGSIYTREKCSICNQSLRYYEDEGVLRCDDHPHVVAQKDFTVSYTGHGKRQQKRFTHNLEGAIDYLNLCRERDGALTSMGG